MPSSTDQTDLDVDAGRLRHVRRAIAETPWAILPGTFAAITELIAHRAGGGRFTAEEVRERIGAGPSSRTPFSSDAVAVLPLYGVIVPRATLMTQISGGTSLEQFSQALRSAAADPNIGSILIDVDSPGGSVDLVPETAAQIRDTRASKRVVAVANTRAASAAYWLASQADELVVTPSGDVGSIGVFYAHDDITGLQEKAGVKTTLVSAGRYKTEGNPYEPLTEEATRAMQALVDDFYGMFLADVARGRAATVDAVRGGFGEGRMVRARAAVAAGMADRVDTFDATLARLLRGPEKSGARAAEPDHPQPKADDHPGSDRTLLSEIHDTIVKTTTSLKEAHNHE